MSLILRQVVGYQQGKRASLANADPELKNQLQNTQKQLNSILNKWKFGEERITTAPQFLSKFEPWIETQIQEQKNLKLFLARKGMNNLQEAENKLTNRELSEATELTQVKEELTQLQTTWNNTEEDYLKRIEKLETQVENLKEDNSSHGPTFTPFTYDSEEEETPFPSRQKLQFELAQAKEEIQKLKDSQTSEDYHELETERDQLARDKLTLEQEVLATNNQLKLKNQEVSRKEKEIERLKKEASQKDQAQKEKLQELKSDLEKAQKAHEDLKKKYSKKSQQLDEEQLENNKLTEKVETLEAQIQELTH